MCDGDSMFSDQARSRRISEQFETEKRKRIMDICHKAGIEAAYRCDAGWAGKNSVLVEAVSDTARHKRGELIIISLG